jgi:hypothetical protein
MLAIGTPCFLRNAAEYLNANGHVCEVLKQTHKIATYTVLWKDEEWGAFEWNLVPLTPPAYDMQTHRDLELSV